MSDFFKRFGKIDDHELVYVAKGWGFERWIANGAPYCLKELHVSKGRKCSYHYHRDKDETFLLVRGEVAISYSRGCDLIPETEAQAREELIHANWRVLSPGDVFHVPPGMRHQFYGLEHSLLIEASTFHDDRDVVRLVPGD